MVVWSNASRTNLGPQARSSKEEEYWHWALHLQYLPPSPENNVRVELDYRTPTCCPWGVNWILAGEKKYSFPLQLPKWPCDRQQEKQSGLFATTVQLCCSYVDPSQQIEWFDLILILECFLFFFFFLIKGTKQTGTEVALSRSRSNHCSSFLRSFIPLLGEMTKPYLKGCCCCCCSRWRIHRRCHVWLSSWKLHIKTICVQKFLEL